MLVDCKYERVELAAAWPRMRRNGTILDTDRLRLVAGIYRPHNAPATGLTAVLLHCNEQTKESWEGVLARLLPSATPLVAAVAIDFVACGESAAANRGKLGLGTRPLDGTYDLIEVIRALDLPAPIVLIGHSLGAVQGLWAAAMYPRLFERVVAIEPPLAVASVMTVFYARLLAVARSLPATFTSREAANKWIDRSYMAAFDPAVLERQRGLLLYDEPDGSVSWTMTADQSQQMYHAMAYDAVQVVRALKFVHGPVSLLRCSKNSWMPDDAVDIALRETPEIELVLMEDAVHLCVLQNPAVVANTLKPLLAKTWAGWERKQAAEKQLAAVPRAELLRRDHETHARGLDSVIQPIDVAARSKL
ncbi:Alpha/Beta hydrolase protein [Dipodascopsis tothii]|uniref:Alpha/Beta hydrolase protein n=1 Tax=Dipodascopsis tothii TaxID=44089 RepID=UPI0034CE2989